MLGDFIHLCVPARRGRDMSGAVVIAGRRGCVRYDRLVVQKVPSRDVLSHRVFQN
jgi:hypothetical protein